VKDGKSKLGKLFKNFQSVPLWVPFAELGYKSAKKIETEMHKYVRHYGKKPEIVFMQNHGLIVSSQDSDTGVELARKVVKKCKQWFCINKPLQIKRPTKKTIEEVICVIQKAVFEKLGQKLAVLHYVDKRIAAFLESKEIEKICAAGAITPEESLLSHGAPVWIGKCDVDSISKALLRRFRNYDDYPLAILIKPLGLFIIGDNKTAKVIKSVVNFHLPIRAAAAQTGEIHSISVNQRKLLTHI
jgi:rhamnose utilization protein RhaD (predicted bifunctional aldolase and dehydrogenase)